MVLVRENHKEQNVFCELQLFNSRHYQIQMPSKKGKDQQDTQLLAIRIIRTYIMVISQLIGHI